LYKEFQHLRTKVYSFEDSVLTLTPARRYRVVLKFCAGPFCFKPQKSSGVTIIPYPPVPDFIKVQYVTLQKQVYNRQSVKHRTCIVFICKLQYSVCLSNHSITFIIKFICKSKYFVCQYGKPQFCLYLLLIS
jgi:hypothetical protein